MGDLEKLYYIMDGSGNYYRVNNMDQLVVAGSKDEAGIFGFVDANKRVGGGKKAFFYSIIAIDEEGVNEEGTGDANTEEGEKHPPIKERKVISQVVHEASVRDYTYDLSEVDWLEYLKNFSYISSSTKKYQDELNQHLSEVDQKICDVMHLVELNELDEEESIEMIHLLKALREERRKVKDEMFKSEQFFMTIGTNSNVAKAASCIKQIEKMDSRRYTPRLLTEIFVNHKAREEAAGNNKNEHYEMGKTDAANKPDGMIVYQSAEQTKTSYKEESIMDYRPTPYDGIGFDWMGFAKMQVEFFEHARQYAYNLEVEIDDIDREIEDTLRFMENANCNVAQGYKYFKKLKDLRNARKAKIKECQCVRALTDGYDCEYMKEAYEYSLGIIEDIMVEEKMTEDINEKEKDVENYMCC